MAEVTRREFMGTVAVATGGLVVAQTGAPAAAAAPASSDLPSFRFPLEAQKAKETSGGWGKGQSVVNFPVAKNLAGVSMLLHPGGLRELHWHANAAEWGYVLTGRCRVTTIEPGGGFDAWDIAAGDIWYFPRGYGHAIQNLGSDDTHFLLVFDNGVFREDNTFSISDWMAHTPREVLAQNLGVAAATFDRFPKGEVWMAKGATPGPLPVQGQVPPGPQHTPSNPHIYHLRAQQPRVYPGGTLRVVSSREFAVSTTMTGALMTIEPGGLRDMHWHPNADEWQYYITGRARMTVFAAGGRSELVEFGPGEVGYIPQGYGHYIENTGSETTEVLIAFNSGEYQDISLAEWMAGNPRGLVATNFGVPDDVVARFRHTGVITKR